jgi:protein involved in polysaccharide export with SLBB domain
MYYVFAGLCLFLLHWSVPAQVPSPSPENPAEMSLIHFGDLIDIDVVGSFEFDWRGNLNPEGYLAGFDKIPDPVYGLCRSEGELAALIAKEYGKILRDPHVIVKVIDRSNRPFSVLQGAVKTPQRFQIKRTVFLNELLIIAGGLNDRASGEIRIFRPQGLNCQAEKDLVPADSEAAAGEGREKFIKASQGNGPETLNIRISDLLRGDKQSNPQILSGDIITVAEARPIYVIGGVNTPKQLSSRSKFTLTRAIASAGGLSKEGLEKVVIFRRRGRESLVIEANLERIKGGLDPDLVLEAYDIVDVSQKGREKRKTAPVVDTNSPDQARSVSLPLRIVD